MEDVEFSLKIRSNEVEAGVMGSSESQAPGGAGTLRCWTGPSGRRQRQVSGGKHWTRLSHGSRPGKKFRQAIAAFPQPTTHKEEKKKNLRTSRSTSKQDTPTLCSRRLNEPNVRELLIPGCLFFSFTSSFTIQIE